MFDILLTTMVNAVKGDDYYVTDRTVDVHIRRLRKILEVAKLDHYIQTVRSHGYRFVTEENQ